MKQKLYCWLPVILLPALNIIITLTSGATYDLSSAWPWVIGAIIEELVFRWFVLKKLLLSRLTPNTAIILVAILFAGLHLLNLWSGTDVSIIVVQMFFAFCFSIWAGYVTYRFTFLIPLLAHVLLNLTSTTDIWWVYLLVSAVMLLNGLMLMKSQYEQTFSTQTSQSNIFLRTN